MNIVNVVNATPLPPALIEPPSCCTFGESFARDAIAMADVARCLDHAVWLDELVS